MVLGWLKEIGIVVGSALILSFLIKTFLFQSFWIPSSSMEPTLDIGDRILVTKLRPGPMDLRRGDVVVFTDPDHWLGSQPVVARENNWLGDVLTFVGLKPDDSGQHLVKRIIGLPGDTVECRSHQGNVIVNGEPIVEPYLDDGVPPCSGPGADSWSVTVPEGHVWLMGDNRPNSADSRYHMDGPGQGFVPIENIVGSAFVTVWPLDHWGGIGNPLAGNEAAEG
ncbi:MAG: signal peptidase I [Demequinaceae bacterium]|nr:signal peptidase I [Demequinaceae bacterium]